ncbi:MAG: M48 family metalloprotease [Candidatus Diapherotrites archaeon]
MALILTFSLLFCFSVVLYFYYMRYTKKTVTKSALLVIFGIVNLVVLCLFLDDSSLFVFLLVFLIFSLLAFLSFLKYTLIKKNFKSKKMLTKIERVPVFVCEGQNLPANAWKDVLGNRIYITEPLKQIMKRKELEIVLRHEIGHDCVKNVWALLIPCIVISLYLSKLFISHFSTLSIGSILCAFLIAYFCDTYICWHKEHCADLKAVKSFSDLAYFRSALLKVELYDKIRPFVKKSEVRQINKILKEDFFNDIENYNLTSFLIDFWSHFFKSFPLIFLDKNFIGPHPPIKFRLLYLANHLKKKSQ